MKIEFREILIKIRKVIVFTGLYGREEWHARRDSNPRPSDSKSTALGAELRAHAILKAYYSKLKE